MYSGMRVLMLHSTHHVFILYIRNYSFSLKITSFFSLLQLYNIIRGLDWRAPHVITDFKNNIKNSDVSHHCIMAGNSVSIVLTLNQPIATKVVCFSRLLKCLRSLYGKQRGPRSDCSYRSSLFWLQEQSVLGPRCLLYT